MFDYGGAAAQPPNYFAALGPAMALAIYSYLGYYNVCYVGDEVRDPGKTIPRSILLSTVVIVVMFVGLHLAMLGTVSWHDVPTQEKELDAYSLPAAFMQKAHGPWAVRLVTVLLIWSCFGAAFAGLLGYARIPYGAALAGHFFRPVAAVHPRHRIPHVSLLLVGGFTLLWSFFDLKNVITALIVTRILEQFVAQIIGLMILRRTRPDMPRPFRLWFYRLPCGLALAGWLYVYVTAGWLYIVFGLVTLAAGLAAYFIWKMRYRET